MTRVTIGMPAFNCQKTLAVAIRSILNQTYENWELLVIEDGSSDHTLELAQSFSDPRISVCTDHTHKGLVARLNQVVARSRGKYFARLDADDVAYPERIERQVEYLERHPEIDLVGCGMLVFKGDGIAVGTRQVAENHEDICRHPADGFCIGHPTWMGRTRWFRDHPYDAKAIRAEDQVLLLRSHLSSRFACLSEILCGYREDALVLGKTMRSRYGFSRAVIQDCFKHGEFNRAIGVSLRQSGKAILDTLAVATGLGYVVLRHRALSVEDSVKIRWAEVWSQLQGASHSEVAESVFVDI